MYAREPIKTTWITWSSEWKSILTNSGKQQGRVVQTPHRDWPRGNKNVGKLALLKTYFHYLLTKFQWRYPNMKDSDSLYPKTSKIVPPMKNFRHDRSAIQFIVQAYIKLIWFILSHTLSLPLSIQIFSLSCRMKYCVCQIKTSFLSGLMEKKISFSNKIFTYYSFHAQSVRF